MRYSLGLVGAAMAGFIKKTVTVAILAGVLIMPLAPVFAQEAPPASPVLDGGSESTVDNTPSLETPADPLPDSESVIDLPASETPTIENPDPNLDNPTEDVIEPELPSEESSESEEKSAELDPESEQSLMEGSGDNGPNPNPNENVKLKQPKADESSGALVYDYEFQIPPGRNGFQPELKLTYNSQNTEDGSFFGYGWSISIPYIERLNKTGSEKLYTDNYFTSSLSGELVSLGSGSYGPKVESGDFLKYTFTNNTWTVKDKKGLTYTFGPAAASRQDDPDDSSKIYKWMLAEIRDLNDNFIQYAYTKNSGQIYPNRIEYTGHGSEAGKFQISFDTTTRQTSGNTHDNFISYKTGFRVLTMYAADKISVRVDGGSGNGDDGVDYQFEYTLGANLNRYMLSSIQTRDWSTGTLLTLPKTTFEYENPVQSSRTWTKDQNWIFPTDGSSFEGHNTDSDPGSRLADLDGDGLQDLISSNQNMNPGQIGKSKIMMNNGQGWVLNSSWSMPTIPVSISGCPYTEYELNFVGDGGQNDRGLRTLDANGDNKADLIVLNQEYVCAGSGFFAHGLWLNNGSGWTKATTWDLPDLYTGKNAYGSSMSDAVRIADLNGDGLPDFVRSYVTPTGTWGTYNHFVNFWLNNGSDWVESTAFTMPIIKGCRHPDSTYEILPIVFRGQSTSRDTGHSFMDVNNDGLSDIVTGSSACNNINMSSGGLTAEPAVWLNTGTTWVKQTDLSLYIDAGHRSWSDINGDNLLDYAWSKFYDLDNPNYQNIQNSVVTNNLQGDLAQGGYWPTSSTPYNGSGSISWTFPTELSCEGTAVPVMFHNQYEGDNAFTAHVGGRSTTTGLQNIDINGDGMPDLFKMNQEIPCLQTLNYSPWIVTPARRSEMWLSQAKKSDLLTKITYPQGGTTQVTYKSSQLYVDGQGNKLNTNVPYVIHTVNTIVNDDKNGNVGTTTYQYEGGKYYYNTPLDKKFAGFNKVKTTDPAGNIVVTYYHQGDSTNSSLGEYSDHASKIGRVYRTEVQDSSGNVYSKSINKWENYDLGNDRNFVKLTQGLDMTYDGNSSHKDKAAAYTYSNTNGNLTQSIDWGEVTGSDNGTFTDTGTDKFTTDVTYASNTTYNILGLPSQETIIDQSSNKVKESKFYYDLQSLGSVDKGNLTKQEQWKTGSTYIDTEKTYNSYGLVTQEKDPRDKTTTYTYDASNLYPATVTNALNQATQYVYDYSSGQVKLVTDPNGIKTENRYDNFDRLDGVYASSPTNFNSLENTERYNYTTIPLQYGIAKTSYLSDTLYVSESYIFDGFNRVKKKFVESEEDNITSRVDYVHDTRGNLFKESLPYYSNGPDTPTTDQNLYSTYVYDPLNRVTSVANVVGTTSNIYDDWKTTITDPRGKIKRLYKDASGNLVKVEEVNNGNTYTTNYEYNGLSNLTKITDANSNIRNFTYDGLGRRLTAQDLHASADSTFGTWTYTYDDAGNMTSTVDPKNQTINYTYDNINRQLTEDYTGQGGTETTYAYDSCTNGVGKLCTVTNAGANEAKEYNSLGLVKKDTKTINSTNYITEYTYDRQGNQVTLKNPDNSEVKNNYNTAGQLETVQRKESTDGSFINVITDFDYGPHGKITYQAYANGTATTNTYDATKLYRLSEKLTTNGSSTRLQDLEYTYDANGNITKIIDDSQTNSKKTVDYTYDDLNRLLSATTTNAVNSQNYYQAYAYDKIGNITYKSDQGTYKYDGNAGSNYANPHAVTSIKNESNGTELLTTPFFMSGNNGSDEKTQSVPANILNGKQSITITYDLHGLCALSGDASAIVFDQNGWKYVGLSNYGTNCLDGVQTVTIPLSDFTGLNTSQNISSFKSRFWFGSTFKVDILSARLNTATTPTTSTKYHSYDNNGNLLVIDDSSTPQASVELLNPALHLTGNNGSDEESQSVPNNILNGKQSITLTYNLHGLCALPGDASAIVFDQNGWKYVGLSNYGTNCLDGVQTVTIPLSDFTGLNTSQNISGFKSRFWFGSAFTVDILSAQLNSGTTHPILSNTWDYKNRLTQASANLTDRYAYDASGQRVKLFNNTDTTYYPSKSYNITGSDRVKHVFAEDQTVATVKGTGGSAVVYSVHTDHLTGSNVVTNSSGTLEELMDYYPFGSIRLDEKAGSFSEQRKFAGHEFDADTGLSYMEARYQNSAIGRFISQDPVFLDVTFDLTDPQSLNSYAYGRNNPLRYNDPTGEIFWDVVDAFITAWDGSKAMASGGAYLGDQASIGLGKLFGSQKLEAVGRSNLQTSGKQALNDLKSVGVDAVGTALPGVPIAGIKAVGKIDNVAKSLPKADTIKHINTAEKIVDDHALNKHVLSGKPNFGNIITNREESIGYVKNVMNGPNTTFRTPRGNIIYDNRLGGVIFDTKTNPTFFQPRLNGLNGKEYFLNTVRDSIHQNLRSK